VCTGLPGVLPVLNAAVVEKAVLLAAAMHSRDPPLSFFDRKNYFYPTCPKATRSRSTTSRWRHGGYLDLPMPQGYVRAVSIHKLHIEEDAGKTKNENGQRRLIDFNRCGVPLVEMVTGPDLRSADEAAQYLIRLRQLLRWLGVSEADMEKGHLRCDANVSIRPRAPLPQPQDRDQERQLDRRGARRHRSTRSSARSARPKPGGGLKPGRWIGTKSRHAAQDALERNRGRLPLLPRAGPAAHPPGRCLARGASWPAARAAPGAPRALWRVRLPEYDADILTSERSLSDYFEARSRPTAATPSASRTG
jgi:aspartyl-tRNA(Asn)/glutamyl-tRNA(Gln) amidotransferase subunit B